MNILVFIIWYYFIQNIEGEEEESKLSKNPLPYFRRKVEETIEDTTINVTQNDFNSNLVYFLIENVKEIFDKAYEVDQIAIVRTSISSATSTLSSISTSSTNEIVSDQVVVSNDTDLTKLKNATTTTDIQYSDSTALSVHNLMPYINKLTYDNYSIFSSTYVTLNENLGISTEGPNKPRIAEELRSLLKDATYFRAGRMERDNDNFESIDENKISNATESFISADMKRSCIICNNVENEKCNDPQNNLIPASICPRVDDLCYSLHTPFGIVDRGCFNVKRNLTIYVCSCNLCNYISISEMPYIFPNKRDWIDNVIELSRTRHLKKSVYKDMSCLSCVVNAFSKSGDMLDNANCLEGNIASLPTKQCKDNEICGVKAIKEDGYLWRGCIKNPLYNYFWTFCDSDLCNYDMIASIYDTT